MKKSILTFVFVAILSFFSSEAIAQKVSVETKNIGTEQLQCRVMQGGKQINSFPLRANTGRTDQIPVGATLEIKCNGKWIAVGTVASDRNKNKFKIECN